MKEEEVPEESLAKAAQELHFQRRYREAEEKYRAAIVCGRGFKVLYLLGVLLAQDGRPSEAVAFLEEASSVNAASYEIERELGAVYQRLGRSNDAIERYNKSISLEPNQPNVLYVLFQLLVAAHQFDVALAQLKEVIQRAPYMAMARHLLANIHFYLGDMQEALAAIREAIRIEPANGKHYRILTYMKKFTEEDPELAAIEKLHSRQASMPLEQVIAVKFALNKAYDDVGRKQEAFDLLVEANQLVRGQIYFSTEGERAAAERTMAAFTHDAIRSRSGAGNLSDRPVFILGMPRSGTSLVEQILSAHPSVAATGETSAFHKAVETVLPNYKNDPSVEDEELERLASLYLATNEVVTRGAARFTDKMLGNLWYVGLIHLTFPNARFVHVVRDPIDTCLSCYATKFGGDRQPFAYDLYEIGFYYRLYEDLMGHWRRALRPNSILKVRYENLVQDLRGQTERLLAHVGIEWWEGCLSFEDNPNPVSTASAGQVRQPLYRSSVRRWRPERAALSPLLDGLGPYAGLDT